MGALTPEFLFTLEKNMRLISSREYERLNSNLWWPKVAKRMESKAKAERISWLLDTAKIERPNAAKGGGQAIFEDIVSVTTEYEAQNAVAGLKLKKEQLDDLDGNGVQLATHWSRQVGSYAAYWPQKMVAAAILANATGYDAKAFFATDHPLNPFDTTLGTYANDFTGAASGSYPGACPIDTSVTVDVALANLGKLVAYIEGAVKMPNGLDPRFLKVAAIIVPPALTARAQQLTNAKLIAQAAATGGGGADVEAVVRNFGLGQPIVAPELGAAFTSGSDTTFYIAVEQITSDELGAFTYVDREPFSVLYHGPQDAAELARKREFQWLCEGRNVVGAGHPFLLFRCRGA